MNKKGEKVSVSLRSYIHSYWSLAWSETTEAIAFPSPYRVIFILILIPLSTYTRGLKLVSVSLRSIIHFYLVLWCFEPKSSQVSVSLWSIVHSYYNKNLGGKKWIEEQVSVSLRSIIHSY